MGFVAHIMLPPRCVHNSGLGLLVVDFSELNSDDCFAKYHLEAKNLSNIVNESDL